MQQFEQAPVPEDIKDNNLRPLTITLDPVTAANGSITVVTEDERITEDMKPISIEVGTPETFKAPITVATASETATLTCPNAVGSSTVKVTFVKTSPVEGGYDYPPAVTSTEFDILADRIGSLSTLTTTAKTSAVDAINELDSDLGSLSSASAVTGADAFSKISTLNSNIGTLSSLTTTAKTSAVAAINEVNGAVAGKQNVATKYTVPGSGSKEITLLANSMYLVLAASNVTALVSFVRTGTTAVNIYDVTAETGFSLSGGNLKLTITNGTHYGLYASVMFLGTLG